MTRLHTIFRSASMLAVSSAFCLGSELSIHSYKFPLSDKSAKFLLGAYEQEGYKTLKQFFISQGAFTSEKSEVHFDQTSSQLIADMSKSEAQQLLIFLADIIKIADYSQTSVEDLLEQHKPNPKTPGFDCD